MSGAWSYSRIGDVLDTGAGGTPLKSRREYYEGGTIPWLLSGEVAQGEISHAENFITKVGLDNSSAKIFPSDTVLVAMYGATAGQVGILRFSAATNQAVCGILPNKQFDPKFVFYALLSKKDELIAKASGNAQPNISQIKIKNTEIPILSLREQRRIVTILDEAFEGIATATANAEKNLANARELFESHRNSILAGRSEGWSDTTIGAEVDLLAGPAFKSSGYTASKAGIRLLRGDNVIQNSLRWDDVKRWSENDVAQYERYRLECNDIVLAMDRTWVKAGLKYATISHEDLPSLLVQRVARLRCRKGLLPRYLSHVIGSRAFEEYVLGIQTGLGVPHISGQQISDFGFAKPSLSEQRRIAESLDRVGSEVGQLISIGQDKLAILSELRQSILKKAFSGELTSLPSNALKAAAE